MTAKPIECLAADDDGGVASWAESDVGVASGAAAVTTSPEAAEVQDVDVTQLQQLIQAQDGLLVLDVRSQEEWDAG